MLNKIKKISFILIVLLIIGCGNSDTEPNIIPLLNCDSSNTIFKQLYNQTDLASPISNQNLYDNNTL